MLQVKHILGSRKDLFVKRVVRSAAPARDVSAGGRKAKAVKKKVLYRLKSRAQPEAPRLRDGVDVGSCGEAPEGSETE